MLILDQNTLIAVICSITFLMGILMLHFAKNNPSISGPSLWSSGSFSILLGIAFYFSYPQSAVMVVFASTSVILGVSLFFAGIRSFNRRKTNVWLILAFPLVQFIEAAIFFSVWSLPYLRIALFSSINTILAVLIIREFLRPVSQPYRIAYRSGFFVFLVFGLTSFARVTFALILKPQLIQEMAHVNVVLFFLYCLITVLLLFVFVLMINIELTERLNDKIASQQKFHSIIAHDLIGPVGSISQMLNEINGSGIESEEDRNSILKDLELLSKATYHLLQNLLLWSRNQLDRLSPTIITFDLNMVILRNIELQRQVSKTKNISIVYTENPGLMCYADDRMIDTVIRNLLSNAIKFTHSKGEIVVESENSGVEVQVKIKDSGVGMNESTLNNLFVTHRVLKAGTGGDMGTGLGLMLCKEFVEQNGGSLKVYSRENIGTEIVIILPAGQQTQPNMA